MDQTPEDSAPPVQDSPAPLGDGTDVGAEDLDPQLPAEKPATSDPAAYTDDGMLGGTQGGNAGGAG
ncbi:MAG TPA: hypothetical protein VNA30_08315 [Mycobacteriales bacterium]|nr:hypothetical protein [Mycobacteriales bacterium]